MTLGTKQLVDLKPSDIMCLTREDAMELLEWERTIVVENLDAGIELESMLRTPEEEQKIYTILNSILECKVRYAQDFSYSADPGLVQKRIGMDKELFYHYLKILYVNEYIEPYAYDLKEHSVSAENYLLLASSFANEITQLRANLTLLYQRFPTSFNMSLFDEEFSSYHTILHRDRAFELISKFGSVTQLVISSSARIHLADKGMHFLYTFSNKQFKNNISELKDINKNIHARFSEQNATNQKLTEKLTEGNIKQKEMSHKLEEQEIDNNFLYWQFSKSVEDQEKMTRELQEQKAANSQLSENLSITKQEQEKLTEELREQKAANDQLSENLSITEQEQKKIGDKLNKSTERINDFYKEIITILSILVGAFSFIGVNISSIAKIEENFTEKIIAINASLLLVIAGIFWILTQFVFENKRQLPKKFYWIPGVSLTALLIVLIMSGGNLDKSNAKTYKDALDKQKKAYEQKLDAQKKNYEQKIKDVNSELQNSNNDLADLKTQVEQLNRDIGQLQGKIDSVR